MRNETKLVVVKTLHTAVWAVMAASSIYILYAGVMNTTGTALWAAIALLALESAVLVANGWVCPLTPIAMRYTDDRTDNFDIYLPRIVAKHNKAIFGGIFAAGLVLVAFNALS